MQLKKVIIDFGSWFQRGQTIIGGVGCGGEE
jgi:hypothetical protein